MTHRWHILGVWKLSSHPVGKMAELGRTGSNLSYRVSHGKVNKVIWLCWRYRFWFFLIFLVLQVHELGTFMPFDYFYVKAFKVLNFIFPSIEMASLESFLFHEMDKVLTNWAVKIYKKYFDYFTAHINHSAVNIFLVNFILINTGPSNF